MSISKLAEHKKSDQSIDILEWIVCMDWQSPSYGQLKLIDDSLLETPSLGMRLCLSGGGQRCAIIVGNIIKFYEQVSDLNTKQDWVHLEDHELMPLLNEVVPC